MGALAPDDVFVSERSSEIRDVVQAFTVPHQVEAPRGAVDGPVRARRLAETNVVFVRYGSPVVVEAAPAGDIVG